MQKRTRKPENNFQKLHRYLFVAIFNWCFFSLVHLDLNYRQFGFWGFVLIYSAGLALLDVVVGAWKDIADRMRQKRVVETNGAGSAQ